MRNGCHYHRKKDRKNFEILPNGDLKMWCKKDPKRFKPVEYEVRCSSHVRDGRDRAEKRHSSFEVPLCVLSFTTPMQVEFGEDRICLTNRKDTNIVQVLEKWVEPAPGTKSNNVAEYC